MSDSKKKISKVPPFIKLSIDRKMEVYKTALEYMLSRPGLNLDRSLLDLLPEEGGVYQIAERGDGILHKTHYSATEWHSLYVGKANNLRDDIVKLHLMGNRRVSPLKKKLIANGFNVKGIKRYLHDMCYVRYFIIKEEQNRELFKHFLISVLNPCFIEIRFSLPISQVRL